MLFLAFGVVFLSTIAGLIWLFLIDPIYGISGIGMLLILLLFVLRKIMKTKKIAEKESMGEFLLHLKNIYGDDKADRIYDELVHKFSDKKVHLYDSIQGINEKFKSGSEAGNEELRLVLSSLGISVQ